MSILFSHKTEKQVSSLGKQGRPVAAEGRAGSVVWNKAEAGEITKDWTFTVPASCITN